MHPGNPRDAERIPGMHSPNMAITLGLKVHALERFLPEVHRPAFEDLKFQQEQDSRRYEERRERERRAQLTKEREAQLILVDKMLRLPRSADLSPLDRTQLESRALKIADALIERRDTGDRLRIAVRHLEQQYEFLMKARDRQREQAAAHNKPPSLER